LPAAPSHQRALEGDARRNLIEFRIGLRSESAFKRTKIAKEGEKMARELQTQSKMKNTASVCANCERGDAHSSAD